jgi:hypothetical protein
LSIELPCSILAAFDSRQKLTTFNAIEKEEADEMPSSARSDEEVGEPADGLSAFEDVRPRLFGIA